jgi:leucyl aminopeptidase (aminopeptidase T)
MQRRIATFAAMLLVAGASACNDANSSDSTAAAPPPASVVPDLEAIAASIVNQSAAVREGEQVVIVGGIRDFELLENIATQVRRAGGDPLLSINSERMDRRYYDEVDAKYDTMPAQWDVAVVSQADVIILVDHSETPDLLAHVPAERRAARTRTQAASQDIFLKRRVRQVEVGNDMYPTHARASRFGLSRDELAAFFWGALQASPDAIRDNGDKLKNLLAGARELHITDPHGTDLRVRLTAGATPFTNDGAISPEEVRAGEVFAYLPAGEVYTRVTPEGTSGVIVSDRQPYQGKFIENFTLRIENGRIAEMTANSGLEPFRALLDAHGADLQRLSVVDFGVNPGLKATASEHLRTWVPEGMFTVSFGNDTWAGGTNTIPAAFPVSIPDATVRIDDRVVIENGVLKLP